jgi:hypothetical protein
VSDANGVKKLWTARDQKANPRHLPIRDKREALALRLADVAPVLGLSVEHYSRKELNPELFRAEELRALAKLFSCDVDSLLAGGSNVVALGAMRRTVPVFAFRRSDDVLSERRKIGEYAPTQAVSTEAYALEVPDNTMAGGPKPIAQGDWVVIDPSLELRPGDLVHALDPATGEDLVRIYAPLHPSNPRAPGFTLRAASPDVDEIYISAADRELVKGRVRERRVVFD